MAQPTPYNRNYAFIDFQSENPTDPLPAAQIEVEYNDIKITLDEILANLALIQRDDGRLANQSVGNDQLEVALRTGINAPTVWAQGTAYSVNDTVVYIASGRSELWLCLIAHTATADFDTDSLVSLYWSKLADFSTLSIDADVVPYDNSGSGLTATDVQAAIDELEDEIDGISAGGISDGDKGDITVSSSGTVWSLDAGVVDTAELANDAVTTAKILDANVTTAKINASAVTTAKINAAAVTTAKIADDAVNLAKMEHGTRGDVLYYGASGVPARLGVGTSGQFLKTNGAGADPAWADAPGSIDVQEFDASGTWNKPAGATLVYVQAWGAGGSGASSALATDNAGPGGGGGGAFVEAWFDADDLGSSETVTIGAGGASVAAGNDGNAGGNTTFGSHITAYGGGAGGDSSSGAGQGGGGGGVFSVGSDGGTTTTSVAGGGPGGGGGNATAEDNQGYGGGEGGPGRTTDGPGGDGGFSGHGGGGGGSGGRSGSGNQPGGDGGQSVYGGGGGGGVGGDGGAPDDGAGGVSLFGGNGGAAVRGSAATAGTQPGGGGGASAGAASGAGGDGRIIVRTF